jgi:hypothetical protein
LSSPGGAQRLGNGHTLICENHGNRIIEVNRGKEIIWKIENLNNPSDARKLPNGNVLIAEWGLNRVIEVNRDGKTVWSFAAASNVSSAFRLPDGRTVVGLDKSTLLVNREGKILRELLNAGGHYAKMAVAPIPATAPD